MEYATFDAEQTGPLTVFWKETFGSLHNAIPVSAKLLRARIFEKVTAVESFDPRSMILALERGRILGLIHVGIQPEAICRSLDPQWAGGDRGLIMLLAVTPDRRRQGIGSELWHRGMGYLEKTPTRIIDGQCLNPFYGNSEGPSTPFWGTPEGIGIPWADGETRTFLSKKNHLPRFQAIQMGVEISAAEAPTTGAASVRVLERACPSLGDAPGGPSRFDANLEFDSIIAVDNESVIGTLVVYPMTEARQGLFGIYETRVLPSHQGKGVGKTLLNGAIERMRARGAERCEVLTIPDLSPGAQKLYGGVGFTPCIEWAVY